MLFRVRYFLAMALSPTGAHGKSFIMFVTFAVASGAFAFSAGCYTVAFLHYISTAMVAMYGMTLLWLMMQGQEDGPNQHPESVYIVGYIATLGGLAGIAVRIGNNPEIFVDYNKILPIVLKAGGVSVLSTLVGLIFMNVLKMMSDHQAHNQEAEDRHIRDMSKCFAEELTRSLGGQENTTAFNQGLEHMSAQLLAGATGMERLATATTQAETNISAIGAQMEKFAGAMTQMETIVNAVSAVWKDLPDHAEAAVKLKEAANSSAAALATLGTSSGQAASSMENLAAIAPKLQAGFETTLSKVNDQLNRIGDFNDVLVRFLEWAKTATPILRELHDGFSDLGQIKDRLRQVADNLGEANRELLKFNAEAINLGKSGTQFATGIAEMSNSIKMSVTDLSRAGNHIKIIGEMADALGQGADSNTLVQFRNHVTDFVASAEAMNGTLEQTRKTLNEAEESVRRFREITLELHKGVPLTRSR